MTVYTHRFLAVPDANVAVARSLVKTMADSQSKGSADGMFQVGLNALGTGTPTHWIASGLIDANFAALLGNSAATHAAYQQAGGTQITLTQIQNLYAAAVIRSDAQGNEQACITALGLKLIRGTL